MNIIQTIVLKYIIGRNKDMFDKIKEALSGKKTYLVAAGTIIGTVLAWTGGAIDTVTAVKTIIEAILACTIRGAVAKVG